MTVLFKNGTANGVGPGIHTSKGGQHVIAVAGVFDGASIDFQVQSPNDPNSTWISNKLYTSEGNDPVTFLPPGYKARAVITSAGGSTDLFMEVRT